MIAPRGRRRFVALFVSVALTSALLVACSPADPSAVRLNEDGSLDFASCDAVDEVGEANATTTLRTGTFGKIDDSTSISVDLDSPIDQLPTGNYISFTGLPEGWDRLDIYVYTPTGGLGAYAYAEHDNLKVGEWRWLDGTTGPDHRFCSIADQQPPAAPHTPS